MHDADHYETISIQNGKKLAIKETYIYSSKNLRTSIYVFPLFNTESLIFKIENIF